MKRGEPLGMTGNSSEAHIHFQVSDQPSLEHGKSLRIKFKNGLETRSRDNGLKGNKTKKTLELHTPASS